MSTDPLPYPPSDTWVAAIHSSEHDFEPIGTAVVIDSTRVLTCAHVVTISDGTVREPLWIAFPKADTSSRRRVATTIVAELRSVMDLALLILREPVPAGVEVAPLRCPKATDLISRAWWAFGFPNRDPVGNSAEGEVGAALGYGWVRLDTRSDSRYFVEPGFSGAGLWSRDYAAVVGVVGQAHSNGDGRAITLHQADLSFPDQKLDLLASWSVEAAGDVAVQQWGWTLARDPEGIRHWRPRARGVSIESERGYRFRGRRVALSRIVEWLDRPESDRRVLVVTGSPGVGKSAVLGRIVTTADAAIRASLPADDEAVRASLGSVSCAVHAKAKTALEVAEEIARAASARLPEQTGDLAPAVREVLAERDGGYRFNVVIDALDEAASPAQAREIIDKIVLPLVETCSDVGTQVVVGTRRRDDGGELLDRFGDALAVIDLDDPEYFAREDLASYALACLQLEGDERPGNPYADDPLAVPFASRIAAMSGQNFLVAGLIARSHGLHDTEAADPEQLAFPATVDSALAAYLQRLTPVSQLPASRVLTALAFAEAPGLPAALWQVATKAIEGAYVGADDLAQFARSSAANFLLETSEAVSAARRADAAVVYRLFHQALNDALMRTRSHIRPRADDERALTRAFIRYGRQVKWENAPSYLLRSLPGHAQAAELVSDLLSDDAYLLNVDLRRLIPVADRSDSAQTRQRARLLRLTPHAITSGPEDRVALFSVTEVLENLGADYRDGDWRSPYRARWASVTPRNERATLSGHHGWVWAVCRLPAAGRELLASAGRDGSVRIWDPQTGEERAILKGHQGRVDGVCPVTVGGQELLASGGHDGTVRIWDPRSGEQQAVLEGHQGRVWVVCPVSIAGQELLASGGNDGTVRIWDPRSGEQLGVLEGHQGRVMGLCPLSVAGQELLASGGQDGTVRIWDPQTGEERATLKGHEGRVNGVCSVTVAGQELLASGGNDRTVRIWEPHNGEQRAILKGHQGPVNGVCVITVAGQELLASGGNDGTVRIWDPQGGQQLGVLEGHQGRVMGLCPVSVEGQELLASGGNDGTVRIWDPQTGERAISVEGHHGWVWRVCSLMVAGQELLASGGQDGTVRIWDPQTGEQLSILEAHQGRIKGLCPVSVDGQELLASGGQDGTVRIWDPETGQQQVTLRADHHPIYGLCPVTVAGQQSLASADNTGAIRIWDPRTGQPLAVLKGHQGAVIGVCPVTMSGRGLLASAGRDGTVRIWDPETGEQLAVLEGHQGRVNGVCPVIVAEQELLASSGDDRTVRIWDPETGEQQAVLEGHQGAVHGLCPIIVGGKDLLASASTDRTVRIWDYQTGVCILTVPTHHTAPAVAWVSTSIVVGLATGILVIKLTL
jgi:WD40 repeat protein